jgi:hypothetical protein
MPAEFLLFSELPPELWIKIWILSFEPRTITWLNARRYEFTNPSNHRGSEIPSMIWAPELRGSIPSQLHVNYKSRDVCKEHYQSLLSHQPCDFNPNIDALYAPNIDLRDLLRLPNLSHVNQLVADSVVNRSGRQRQVQSPSLQDVVAASTHLPKIIGLVIRRERLLFGQGFEGFDLYPEFKFVSQGGSLAVYRRLEDRLVAAGIPRERVPQFLLF